MAKKEIKVNVALEDLDSELVRDVLVRSIEQNEKQMAVYLIQREIEGENPQLVAQINGIKNYVDKLNKLLMTKYS